MREDIAIDAPTFGERLRTARAALGWSQDALAAQADLSEKTVRRAEAGATVSAETRRTLARLLGVDQSAAAPAPVAEPENPYRHTSFDYPLDVSTDPNVLATAARRYLKAEIETAIGTDPTRLAATDLDAYGSVLFGADGIGPARRESAAVPSDYAERFEYRWRQTALVSIVLSFSSAIAFVCLVVRPYLGPPCDPLVLAYACCFVYLAAFLAPMAPLYAVRRRNDEATYRILSTKAAIAAYDDAERTVYALAPGRVGRWRMVEGRVEHDEWAVLEGDVHRQIVGTHVDLTLRFQDTSVTIPSLRGTPNTEAFAR